MEGWGEFVLLMARNTGPLRLGLFHTNWAGSQMPSRDLLKTQGAETSGPDAGAWSPSVSHSRDSWLDNAQWKQEKEAQWWETHQMTARSHAPHTLKCCNPLLEPRDYLRRERAPDSDLERRRLIFRGLSCFKLDTDSDKIL